MIIKDMLILSILAAYSSVLTIKLSNHTKVGSFVDI